MNQKIGVGLSLLLIIGGVTYFATSSDLDPNGLCARAPADSKATGDCIQRLSPSEGGGFRVLGPGVAAPYQTTAGLRCERVKCPAYVTDAGDP